MKKAKFKRWVPLYLMMAPALVGTKTVAISGIKVNAPTKTVYDLGESFDTTGMTVTASYEDGTEDVVDLSKVIITGFDSSKVTEKQTVTVKYAGKTATFDVEIRNIIIPEPEPTHTDGLANEMAEDGKWYVYRDNAVDYGYTGLAANEYGWFMVVNGAVDFGYTGLAANEYGWFMVVNGAVDFGYTGLAANEYGWFMVVNGALDFTYNGLVQNEYGWWKVTAGKVDFNYNGFATNEYGTWYVRGGKVDFSYHM